jgi:hypothetical protein
MKVMAVGILAQDFLQRAHLEEKTSGVASRS